MNFFNTYRQNALLLAESSLFQAQLKQRHLRASNHVLVAEPSVIDSRQLKNNFAGLKQFPNLEVECISHNHALNCYIQNVPDIILLNTTIQDGPMQWNDILQAVLAIDKQAFVVVLSNYNVDDAMAALSNGAQGFIEKPYSSDKLNYYLEKAPYISSSQDRSATDPLVKTAI